MGVVLHHYPCLSHDRLLTLCLTVLVNAWKLDKSLQLMPLTAVGQTVKTLAA